MVNIDGLLGKVEDMAQKVAAPGAFVYAITKGDVAGASAYWPTYSLGSKASFLASSIIYRTTGYATGDFTGAAAYNASYWASAGKAPALNLGKAINPASEVGAGLWIAAEIGFIPAKWKRIGKDLTIWGAIGGALDPDPQNARYTGPQGGTGQTRQTQTNPTIMQQSSGKPWTS